MNKKKIAGAVLSMLVILIAASCDRNKNGSGNIIEMRTPTKAVENFLGKEIVDILQNADSVESYLIEQFKAPKPNLLAGYPIIEKGPNLTDEQKRDAVSILFNDKSYDFSILKKCMFVPQFGLKFKKGNASVVVLLYYGCDMMVFAHGSREIMTNFDPSHHQMQAITGDLFQDRKGGK